MIAAVIFDMDGLLIDSEPCWDKARSLMAADVGVQWNEADHRAVMGVSTREWVAYMMKRLDLTLAPQEVEQQIIDQMVRLYRQQIPFLPGAVEAVSLAAAHYPTALASGSPRALIDTVTSDSALRDRFQAILSGDEVKHGKPSPDIYLAAARSLGVEPEHCVCLEDSGNGIVAGKAAGMKVIAVPDDRFPPAAEKLGQADTILSSLQDLSLATLTEFP